MISGVSALLRAESAPPISIGRPDVCLPAAVNRSTSMDNLLCGHVLSSSPDSVAVSIDKSSLGFPPQMEDVVQVKSDDGVSEGQRVTSESKKYSGYKLTTDRSYLTRLGFVGEDQGAVKAKKRYAGYNRGQHWDRSYLKKLGFQGQVSEEKEDPELERTRSAASRGNTYPSLAEKRYTGYKLTTDRSYLKRLGYVGGEAGVCVGVR
ncbi:hypothetical protein TrVE_jg295 [Triparma verrucosa]|uniref:Uncharacterized protein n=1 Tax=Triparma verrucosa TaxID=1606542 RepID=A0A9W7CC20_9STRA|nr:hypothetical protein TrVE_jg295 [Triparma verrucosa]